MIKYYTCLGKRLKEYDKITLDLINDKQKFFVQTIFIAIYT